MKRLLCLTLAFLMLIWLPACVSSGDTPVSFCYLRGDFTLGEIDSVLAYEQRDTAGRQDALDYLLGIYLNGPLDDKLVSPFPAGTHLVDYQMQGQTLVLEISREFFSLEGIRLTLEASCLAFTCFQLTDAETVQITCRNEIPIVLSRESMTLVDDSMSPDALTEPGA